MTESTSDFVTGDLGTSRLATRKLTTGYGERTIINDLDVQLPHGGFTVIIGPNACGKSTLLRSLARLLKPASGEVILDGRAIATYRTKELARIIGLLPQSSTAPEGLSVAELVARGRYPHQSVLSRWSEDDEQAVQTALEDTNLTALAERPVDELSGGQRQRVWIAMTLAQQTPLLLLDEPTTFLDIAHQVDVLELCRELNTNGRTLVAVLHDLNQAVRYATHLIAMKDGEIAAQGDPAQVVTAELIKHVFGLDAVIIADPETGRPMVVPKAPEHHRTGKVTALYSQPK